MNLTNIKAKQSNYAIRTNVNDMYVKELAKIPLLTASEEKELFVKYNESKKRVKKAEGTENYGIIKQEEEKIQLEIRNEIITRNQRLNYAAAKRYDNNEIMMELVSVGTIGMIEAFEEYDIKKNVRFCTYAMYYIRRAINAFFLKNETIRVSNDMKIKPKVKKIENDFYLKEGRYPSIDEIKIILNNEYNISNVNTLDLLQADMTYIDAPLNTEDKDKTYTILASNEFNDKTADYNGVVESMELEEKRNIINKMFKNLTEREQIIMSLSTGYNCEEEMCDDDIAAQLDLSVERVRQLKKSAIKKLQEAASFVY